MRKRPVRRAANAAFTFGWTATQSAHALGRIAAQADADTLRGIERRWAKVLLRAWGIRLSVEGLERVPRGQRLVIICNHQSYIDVVALFSALPELPVFLAKKELRNIPLFGRAMESIGHVFVDRQNRERAHDAIDEVGRALRPGLPVVIFPEGTRASRACIQPFKKGAFHLAKAAGTPILVVGITGSVEAWPRGTSAPVPGPVTLHVGGLISASDVDALPLDGLIDRARGEMAELTGLPMAARADETAR